MPAGYSGTPLARKLGITAGHHVALIDAPPDFEKELAPLPEDVRLSDAASDRVDVILAFFTAASALDASLRRLGQALTPAGGLWVAWPKKSSGVATDVTEHIVRETGLAAGFVDNKVCAVTDVWSGLRFVYRLQDRPR